jgi:hypothetical protein
MRDVGRHECGDGYRPTTSEGLKAPDVGPTHPLGSVLDTCEAVTGANLPRRRLRSTHHRSLLAWKTKKLEV